MSELATIQNNDMSLAMESVLIDGDLSKLSPSQRVMYYKKTCESLGLNYLTKPFAYIRLNGKLTLYALKDCTEQLRKRDNVSIYDMKTLPSSDVYVVTAYARTADGKEDVATGVVSLQGLKGESLANAYMKAETKAKRRVTLSICGLGMTDEGEIDTIPNAEKINVNFETGEIEDHTAKLLEEIAPKRQQLMDDVAGAKDINSLKNAYAKAYTVHAGNLELMKDITQLKEMRKKQLEEFKAAIQEGTFEDPLPLLENRVELLNVLGDGA